MSKVFSRALNNTSMALNDENYDYALNDETKKNLSAFGKVDEDYTVSMAKSHSIMIELKNVIDTATWQYLGIDVEIGANVITLKQINETQEDC